MKVEIAPTGSMELLSQLEVDRLKDKSTSKLYNLFRNCSFAVLNSNVTKNNNHKKPLKSPKVEDFKINVIRKERGVKIELTNPPANAFVDGKIIKGIQEHLFSVLRDVLYVSNKYQQNLSLDFNNPAHITHMIFDMLRNANVIHSSSDPNMIVCWGGHSISDIEFEHARAVGHELGLRSLNICTGCGPGAMEGPMKGAAIGLAKQRIQSGRFLGLTEPSIIAAERPNPIVNELVILPDIEKRLEAFVRISHGIIVFPGGVGTAEEILYILGILLSDENIEDPLPIILSGPKESKDYFYTLDNFIKNTLGEKATKRYQIIIGDPEETAKIIAKEMPKVRAYRRKTGDAYHFNWALKITSEFQKPFIPTHENVAKLNLHKDQKIEDLAANLRKTFSAIVAGNVKEQGIKLIQEKGPFIINGDKEIMQDLDKLLTSFARQNRMKLNNDKYNACYKLK